MIQDELNRQLFSAAYMGRIHEVRKAIKKGADVNAKDEHGQTPLYWSISWGQPKTAKLLIEKGADVNAKDEDGNTPLRCAAYFGILDVGNLLIDQGGRL